MDSWKRFLLSILLFGYSLSCGCTWPEPGEPSKERSPNEDISTLTIAYEEDTLLHLPLYVAIQNNYFTEENLQIELQKYSSKREAVEGLVTGHYHLLLSTPELAFFLYQQGQQNKLVYLAQCAVKNGWFLLARKTAPTGDTQTDNLPPSFNWQNTKGKIILGTRIGDLSEIILENILRQHELHPLIDVHLINNLPPSLRLGTFQSGTAHFFLATEPSATVLEKEDTAQLVTSFDQYTGALLTSVICADKEKLPAMQEAYDSFIKALSKALLWIHDHSPDELAQAATSFFPQLDEKTLLRGIARYKNLGCWPKSPLMEEPLLHKLHDYLLQAGELNSALPAEAVKEFIAPPPAPEK